MRSKRIYPKDCTPEFKRQIDNLSDYSAYAFGFSDEKPGWTHWLILGVMSLGVLGKLLMWW
jgi:hypothetical protein